MEQFDRLPLSVKLPTLIQMLRTVKDEYVAYAKANEITGFSSEDLKIMSMERLVRAGEDRAQLDTRLEEIVVIVDELLDLEKLVKEFIKKFGLAETTERED